VLVLKPANAGPGRCDVDGGGCGCVCVGCAVAAEVISMYGVGTGNELDLVRRGKEEEQKRYLENGKRKLGNLNGANRAAKELEDQLFELCEKRGPS
jgi:predicted metal-dependent hydrolase